MGPRYLKTERALPPPALRVANDTPGRGAPWCITARNAPEPSATQGESGSLLARCEDADHEHAQPDRNQLRH